MLGSEAVPDFAEVATVHSGQFGLYDLLSPDQSGACLRMMPQLLLGHSQKALRLGIAFGDWISHRRQLLLVTNSFSKMTHSVFGKAHGRFSPAPCPLETGRCLSDVSQIANHQQIDPTIWNYQAGF